MKKRPLIVIALSLIIAGAALIYADRRLGLHHQTAITLASIYGALGFASLGILERDWRSALILALCGVMVGDGSLRILPDKSMCKRARQDERFVIQAVLFSFPSSPQAI